MLWAILRWCGPCHRISPVLEAVSDEHAGNLVVLKVDVRLGRGASAAKTVLRGQGV